MRGSNRFTADAPLPRFGFGVSPHDAGPAHRFGVCEAMMHVAVHAGVPAANHALKIVKQTLAEMEGGEGEGKALRGGGPCRDGRGRSNSGGEAWI
jgi:hypothetical protein